MTDKYIVLIRDRGCHTDLELVLLDSPRETKRCFYSRDGERYRKAECVWWNYEDKTAANENFTELYFELSGTELAELTSKLDKLREANRKTFNILYREQHGHD